MRDVEGGVSDGHVKGLLVLLSCHDESRGWSGVWKFVQTKRQAVPNRPDRERSRESRGSLARRTSMNFQFPCTFFPQKVASSHVRLDVNAPSGLIAVLQSLVLAFKTFNVKSVNVSFNQVFIVPVPH